MPRAEWQLALLAAIKHRYKSARGYARYLAGDDATKNEIESHRRTIQKWLEIEKPAIPDPESLARLRADGIEFDESLIPRRQDRRLAIADLAARQDASLENQENALVLLRQLVASVEKLEVAVDAFGSDLAALRNDFEEWRRAG